MKREAVKKAIEEAQKFIDRAETLIEDEKDRDFFWGSKASGATRRASMELTRALAEMRRP